MNALKNLGAESLGKGDYNRARELIDACSQMTTFRDKVLSLQKEWKNLFGSSTRIKRVPKERLKKGARTPEDFFRAPILLALSDLGGSAPLNDVLNNVYKIVKGKLNKHDLRPIPSNPKIVRWQNTAQWCRYSMVKEGLLKSDSPRGVWELTEEGKREALRIKGAKPTLRRH